jgi:hypothetical protein
MQTKCCSIIMSKGREVSQAVPSPSNEWKEGSPAVKISKPIPFSCRPNRKKDVPAHAVEGERLFYFPGPPHQPRIPTLGTMTLCSGTLATGGVWYRSGICYVPPLRKTAKGACRTHEGLPVRYWRKVGMTSSPHGPYGLGHTRATMAMTMGSKAVRRSESGKIASVRIVLCNSGTGSRNR